MEKTLASYFHNNGIFVNSDFFHIIDKAAFDSAGINNRNEIIKLFQRKYNKIEKLNSSYNARYKYFEELPVPERESNKFYSVMPGYDNSFLAIDYFSFFSMWDEYGLKRNKLKSEVLILENTRFYNFFRSKIDFLVHLGVRRVNIVDETEDNIAETLLLQDLLLDNLHNGKYAYNHKSSDILFEELVSYKMIILFSDLFIDEEFQRRLIHYCENGGVLLVLGKSNTLSKFANNKIMDIDTKDNFFNISLFLLKRGNLIFFSAKEDYSDALKKTDTNLCTIIENISGIKFEQSSKQGSYEFNTNWLIEGVQNFFNKKFREINFYDKGQLIGQKFYCKSHETKLNIQVEKVKEGLINIYEEALSQKTEHIEQSAIDHVINSLVREKAFSID